MVDPQKYGDLSNYPANPYIQQRQNYAQIQASTARQGANIPLDNRGGMEAPLGGGWWSPPVLSGQPKSTGEAFLQKKMSPMFMQARSNIYNAYGQQPQSLAEMWQGYMEGNPELEQMDYNRQLARLKGQMGTSQQALMAGLAPGGMDSGGYTGALADIQRQFQTGVGELGIQQYMKALQDREARQQAMIGYANQDIANKAGWLQGYGGWMQQISPTEQWAIQFPMQQAAARQEAAWNRALQVEQMNMARRNEAMGWLDKAMQWQGQGANQYYGGQNQWLGYKGQQGQARAGGYGPQWNPYQ